MINPAYQSYAFSTLDEKDLNYRNALRCLSIVHHVLPYRSVVDFGCGIGAWMAAASALGASKVVGIDGPWIDAVIGPEGVSFDRGQVMVSRDSVLQIDMAEHDAPDFAKAFDLAISIEVAEHLPDQQADMFCSALAKASDCILFSAATPGQGGFLHINEQPLSYWAQKFWKLHYVPVELVRPLIINDRWMYGYIRRNIVFFVNYAALLTNNLLLRNAVTPDQISCTWTTYD